MITFDELFGSSPVMAILRGLGIERTVAISRSAWRVGVTCVEVPLQSKGDAETLAELARIAQLENRIVGAGTVLDREGVSTALACGARFTVSPAWDPDIARASLDAGMPHLPGVGSGTDVHQARRFGLSWVKAFPAAQLGSEWITAMHGPFPDIAFVATGGMDSKNAQKYLDAGARAVAIGSALADPLELERVRTLH